MRFTAACVQFAPAKAEVAKNLDSIAGAIRQAAGEGARLVVFPEAATSGYYLEGGVLEAALTDGELLEQLQNRLSGARIGSPTTCVIGFYEKSGGNLYNSVALVEVSEAGGCTLTGVYRKFFLPTYGVFDEERFVSRGRELGVFDTSLGRIGVLICEDVWHSVLAALLALRGAQVVVVPSASPARGFSGELPDNLERYERMLRAVSEEHGVWCLNCQLCGFEGGKGFVGGSSVVDPFGRVAARSPVMDEHVLLAEIDLDQVQLARSQTPLVSDLQSAWGDVKRLASDTE